MRKIHVHIEVVSVEEAKKALKREKLLAARNSKRKLVGFKKSRKSSGMSHARPMKSEVAAS